MASKSNSTSPSPLMGLELIEDMTRNAGAVQEKMLAEILAQNADTEYLKPFNLDRNTFKSKVPIVTYEDIKPLIQRIADGDRSPILCAQPVTAFIMRPVLRGVAAGATPKGP
ncbi:Probable indole-3-acetic acid-amido synthetase GH3.1 [Striga hermonthica]|uniref:Probable indole-3-acetic acid-amido synthetase GH3.1 n=1 Tax=Striga hermonthica TaxID=68872 RepID=A0A9N7R9Y3_STRHE|nr:Probable indole-3-acetic acid-amido synthetase GH3.1 [Striga hermonthica]